MPSLTKEALNLIKSHEGLRLTAYKCPAGLWTIGYGCRIRGNDGKFVDSDCIFENLPLQKITESEAEKMLLDRIAEFEIAINKNFKNIENLNENQYSAFVSLVYNCGIAAIGSGLRNLIENDRNNFEKIKQIWTQYNKSGGKILPGLVKRRQEEVVLYCNINQDDAVKKHMNTTNKTEFSSIMSNSIISTLAEKGIDIAAGFIPGGSQVQSVVKSIAKSLLGNENASEEQVKAALQKANPEQLEWIRLEIAKFQSQAKIEEEDTKQAIEQTRQFELKNAEKLMDLVIQLINRGNGKYVAIAGIFYYILLVLIGIFYHFSDFDTFTRHCVIGLLTVMCFIPFSPFIGNGVMNRILNSLCDIFLNIAEIGKGISSAPKMVVNKVLKK